MDFVVQELLLQLHATGAVRPAIITNMVTMMALEPSTSAIKWHEWQNMEQQQSVSRRAKKSHSKSNMSSVG